MRYLEFGTVNHLAFFWTLEGCFPNLRSYKQGPRNGFAELRFHLCSNHFLTTVGPLEGLVIDNYDSDITLELATIEKHGATLRSLRISSTRTVRMKRDTFWSAEDLRIITLTRLGQIWKRFPWV